MERWGRKAGLLFGSVLSIPALAGMTGSMNVEEFLVFRFIAGLGTWACGAAGQLQVPRCMGGFSAN
jgi:MFS family permease